MISSVAGTFNYTLTRDDTGGATTVSNDGVSLAASTPSATLSNLEANGTGGFERGEVQAVYRNATRVITLNLHMVANDATGRCQMNGTAVPAS